MLNLMYIQAARFAHLTTLAALLLLLASPTAVAEPGQVCDPFVDFDDAVFESPTGFDNKWFPLQPGTQFTYTGTVDDDGETVPAMVVFTVTDMTKEIFGVNTLVIWDQDFRIVDGEQVLVEEELAFFAQDEDGNVWNFGEYSEEFEEGEGEGDEEGYFVYAGSPSTWLHRLGDSAEGPNTTPEAGILVLGKQVKGTLYLQGDAPNVDFLDCGQVYKKAKKLRSPLGRKRFGFKHVQVVRETSPPEVGAQLKYYARDQGLVKIEAEDDPQAETLTLVEQVTLGTGALAIARQNVKRLEFNAYVNVQGENVEEEENIIDTYGLSEPAVQISHEEEEDD